MSGIPTTIITDLKWLRAHVIQVIVTAAIGFGAVYGVETLISSHEAKKDVQWSQVLAAQTAQTNTLMAKISQDEANWSQQNAQNQRIIATLAQSIAKRDAATKQQQQVDSTLSAQAAAVRLTEQTKAEPGEVVANGNMIQLDLPVARVVVQNLDMIPALQGDLADTQKQLDAQTETSTNLQA